MGRVEGWPGKCWWWKCVKGGMWMLCGEVEGSLLSLPLICPSIISQAWSVLGGAFIWMPLLSWKKVEEDPHLLTSPPFLWSRDLAIDLRQGEPTGILIDSFFSSNHRILFLSCSLLFYTPSTHTTMNGYAHTHACLVIHTHTHTHTQTHWWQQRLTAWAKASIHSTTDPTDISPPTLVSLRFLKGKTSVEGWAKIWERAKFT